MTNSAFHYCNGCDGYDCDEDKGCSYPGPRPVAAPQHPARGADAFRNMFAILHNLGASELMRAGVLTPATRHQWTERDLTTFVLKLDDARLDALYALVQSRQPAKYRDHVGEVA